jgi:pimeloyl-ACP methyl ester carboxylesterase
MTTPFPTVEAWERRGRRIDTPDGRVFVVEAGGFSDRTPVLLLHGFPTSSWDFAPLVDRLASSRRVVTFDFLGFGLSDKPAAYGYSLFEQADVAIRVARELGLERLHLLAHDMGTSVATELLARAERGLLPIALASFVLMNGSVHIELAHLTPGQRLLRSPLGPTFSRLSTRATFQAQIRRVFAKRPSAEELDAMWTLLARDDGTKRLASIIRYLEERARHRSRWIGALERTRVPALVAWGARDPVAVIAIADRLAAEIPAARRETWDELGHYPQVEDPDRVARTVASFFETVDSAGSRK